MKKFTIEYILGNHGWATVKFSNHIGICESPVSYLHDSLDQLADMAIELNRGLPDAKAVFMDEPGELQLCVQTQNTEVTYEVRQYKDWSSWGMHPQDSYNVILSGTCSLKRVVQQINKVLWKIYTEIGPAEYKERWIEHDFPTEKYQRIKTG